jgi:hypothetical protein
MKNIGLIHDPEMSDGQRALIAEKRAAYEQAAGKKDESAATETAKGESNASGFPPGATLCTKCNTQALVLMDGCQTCLNCGYSKCG